MKMLLSLKSKGSNPSFRSLNTFPSVKGVFSKVRSKAECKLVTHNPIRKTSNVIKQTKQNKQAVLWKWGRVRGERGMVWKNEETTQNQTEKMFFIQTQKNWWSSGKDVSYGEKKKKNHLCGVESFSKETSLWTCNSARFHFLKLFVGQ